MYPYLPNPSAQVGYDTRSIFKRSLTGLNSGFSFTYTSCLTKAKELSLPHYLTIAGGRIIGFIPFPRVLVLCEMQSVSSRIWTRGAVSISYDDNNYTTGPSMYLSINLYIFCSYRHPQMFHGLWGTHSVLVYVFQNEHTDSSSIAGRGCLYFI